MGRFTKGSLEGIWHDFTCLKTLGNLHERKLPFFLFQGDKNAAKSRALMNVINSCSGGNLKEMGESKDVVIAGLTQDTGYNVWIVTVSREGEMGAFFKNTVFTKKASKWSPSETFKLNKPGN